MPKRIDLIGKRFGRLVVTAYAGHGKRTCVCDCGAHVDVLGKSLRHGRSKSCGCLMRELARIRATKHGMSRSREYHSWQSMKQRCFNPRHPGFEYYGGEGKTVCERWKNSFVEFFADMGPCPEGHSIHRVKGDGNYEPSNCIWADAKTQAQNRRRPQRKLRIKLNDPKILAGLRQLNESLARIGAWT